mgnify:CR=1 FL=1|tara:strand:- start:54 stop:1007 length:954 start_codon:yes stop_codon:yes gene_type:complete
MANRIQIKRHNLNNDSSPPGSLLTGELAFNQQGKKLYIGRHDTSNVEVFHLPTLQDITYGNGVTGTVASGSNDNSVTLAVDVTASAIFATTSAKGIAQFNSDNFDVTSGVVTIKDNGVILGTETTGNYVTNLVAGTGITVGSASEGATPTVAIDTSSSPTVAGITADDVRIGVTASNEIDTSSGNLVIDSAGGTTTVDDNLTVSGNLTVNGSTVSVNSTQIQIDDPIFALGLVDGAAPASGDDNDNKDRGIIAHYFDSTAKKSFFGMDDSNSFRFTYIPVATESSGVISGSVGDCQFATGYFTAISGADIDGGTFTD